MANHSRRKFLQALVVSVGMPPLLGGCLNLNYDTLAGKLSRTLARKDLADRVGEAYVKYVDPGFKLDKVLIVESILKGLPITGNDLKSIKLRPLREVLHQQVTMEFSEEKTIPVVGWVLSETETKLCLLVHILKNTNQKA